jgi:serine/threonine protein kinase
MISRKIRNIFIFSQSKSSRIIFLRQLNGSELLEHVLLDQSFSEEKARHLFNQIIEAIHVCHKNGVCLKDLQVYFNDLKKSKAKNVHDLRKSNKGRRIRISDDLQR